MKKSFIFAMCAMMFAMVGCKSGGGEEPSGNTVTITLDRTELNLSPDNEPVKLYATQNPAKGLTLIWSSSDEEVVTVTQQGRVSVVGEGEAVIKVTANAEGYTVVPAECKVTVDDLAAFSLMNDGLFGQNFTPFEPEVTRYVQFVSGDSALCQLNWLYYNAWDENISFVSGSGFTGEGYMIYGAQIAVWVINDDNYEKGEYNGYYVGSANGWPIVPAEEWGTKMGILEGKCDANAYLAFWNGDTEDMWGAFNDSQVRYWNLDEGTGTYLYGHLVADTTCYIDINDDKELGHLVNYNIILDWGTTSIPAETGYGSYYGLKAHFTYAGEEINIDNMEAEEVLTRRTYLVESDNAAETARQLYPVKAELKQMPLMQKHWMDNQIMYRK